MSNSINPLEKYLPAKCLEFVLPSLIQHKVKLTISGSRNTKLGDYRHPFGTNGHRISINSTLKPFSFFITLLHEIAHLHCWEKHGNKVKPHGVEWKEEFRLLLDPVIKSDILPESLKTALIRSIQNPKAASCSDLILSRTLHALESSESELEIHLEKLPIHSKFMFRGKIYTKLEKRKTRYLCEQEGVRRQFLFHSLALVEKVI